MTNNKIPFIVGAYAAIPQDRDGQEAFYQALSDTGYVSGIEIPWRQGALDADPTWLGQQLANRFSHSIVTAIPDTMKMMPKHPLFGIASPDEENRQAGIIFTRRIIEAADTLNQQVSAQTVERIEVQSAPSRLADAQALTRSLLTLKALANTYGLEIVVEHCDARNGVGPGEKEFLSLSEELKACVEVSIPITINWGRSVVESHDFDLPRQQVEQLVSHHLLAGVMCSGAGPELTQYGPLWGDAHLPLQDDEPTSLLTNERVADFIAAARGEEIYRGIKIQVPHDASVTERISMINRIHQAMK